jgi:hypothetical protein
MGYDPVDDIPGIEKHSTNIKTFDLWMFKIIEATRFTLKHPSNLKISCGYNHELLSLLDSYLILYKLTHRSLRLLLGHAYRKKDWATIADATSLGREQVEKIFNIALVLSDPDKWVRQSLRSSFKTDYEEILLEAEENANNPRFQEFLTKHAPEFLEKIRRPPRTAKNQTILVSKLAMRVVKFNWDNPGSKKPAWLKYKGGISDYLRDYFEFPTPGKAAKKIHDPNLRRFLFRWHKEYAFMSQYAHAAVGKMTLPLTAERKHFKAQERAEIFGKKLAGRTIVISQISIATSCILILEAVKNSYGARSELQVFWEKLAGMALPAKALWNMYVHQLFNNKPL